MTDHQLMTIEELANHLKVHKSWIYKETRMKGPGAIPSIRVGKYLRFRLPDVLQWLIQTQAQA